MALTALSGLSGLSAIAPADDVAGVSLPEAGMHSRWCPNFPATVTLNTGLVEQISAIQGSTQTTLAAHNSNWLPYDSSDSLLNNKPAMYCGFNDYLLTANAVANLDVNNGFIAAALYCNTSAGSQDIICDIRRPGTSVRWQVLQNSTGTDFRISMFCFDGSNFKTFGVPVPDILHNTAFVLVAGSVGNVYKVRINGVERLSTANTFFWDDADIGGGVQINIGGDDPPVVSQEGHNWISDLSVYSTWNTNVIVEVENTLAAEYGISI